MAVEWAAPALTGYKFRGEIKDLLEGGLNKLLGRKTMISVTGMAGVGKTVLLDHLIGNAFKPGYSVPMQSPKAEAYKIKGRGKRILVTVVPGQKSNQRDTALDSLFAKKTKVDLALHVVANGFASVRRQTSVVSLINDLGIDTLEKLRSHHLELELEDLDRTCETIRQSHHRHRCPNKLIVIVDKIDLFHRDVDAARNYYSPHADTPFAARLRRLTSEVGSEFFDWDAVPACSRLESYSWNGQAAKPQIREGKRDAYLAQLLLEIQSRCN